MQLPEVAIIILNWNGLADTLGCLNSIRALRYPNCRIFVVDNGSEDESPTVLEALEPEITLIRNRKNLGYTGGNNVAIKVALETRAEYLWLLNNDCVVDPDCLQRLVEFCSGTDSVGLVSPIIYSRETPERVLQTGYLVDWRRRALIKREHLDTNQAMLLNRGQMAVSGAALFASRAVFSDLGPLDDRYFAYWEDIDFSQRALSRGYRNYYVRNTKVFHRSPYTSGIINRQSHYYFYMCRNYFLFWRDRLGVLSCISLYRSHLAYTLSLSVECLARNNIEGLHACLDGAWSGWRDHFGKWDRTIKMPRPIRAILLSHPFLIRSLLIGDMRKVRNLLAAKVLRKT